MSQNVIQTSFASGELSPNLLARVDLEQYRTGAATMRNFFVDYRSGCSTRAGTKFVIQCLNSALPVRLLPFQTSVLVPYVLEFGQNYMRPISFGAPVLETGFAVTAVTLAGTVVLTIPGHNYVVGNWIFVSGLGGTIQLNNRFFVVQAVVGNQVTLADTYGNLVSGVGMTPYTSGGSTGRVYQIVSPYAANDLALLKFVQVGNLMYLTHPAYPPTILTFTAPTSWAFSTIVFGSSVAAPVVTGITGAAGAVNYAYQVTAVDINGQESLPGGGGGANLVNVAATAGTITISWNPVVGAVAYNVYKTEPGVSTAIPGSPAYGFMTTTYGTGALDSNIVPDPSQTPPIVSNPFLANNPGVCCFFQQRLYYGGSAANPQTFWGSQPGFYNNFNISDPIQEDDAITGTLVSLQVNYIKAMVPMPGGLVILTANGAWQLSSGNGGLASTAAVTPINATATPQAYNGISDVPPIVINQDVLYVQYKNSLVRDLTYNIYANIYTGEDISVLSNHLFLGYTIQQWAYAEEPYKVVWCVRNDGILLSLTFLKEQGLKGWARHDTLGLFKSVTTVTEGNLDAAYFVVQRFIQGAFWQFIERMDNRQMPYGAEDAWAVDCGSQSQLIAPAGTLSATGSSGSVTFTSTAPVFSSASVGQIIRMGGGIAQVTQFLNAFQVVGTFSQPVTYVVPNDPNKIPVPAPNPGWLMMPQFTVFHGLDYLNGQTVSILADGNVVAPQIVVNGTITLSQPASKVTVGLGFTAQLQAMPLDLGDLRNSIQGKRKKLNALTVKVTQTRGLSYGQTFNNLSPIKEFSQGQSLGSTIPLVSGDERVIMDPLWDVPGQICLQQTDPLPATVLGVVPEISVGDTE